MWQWQDADTDSGLDNEMLSLSSAGLSCVL